MPQTIEYKIDGQRTNGEKEPMKRSLEDHNLQYLPFFVFICWQSKNNIWFIMSEIDSSFDFYGMLTMLTADTKMTKCNIVPGTIKWTL